MREYNTFADIKSGNANVSVSTFQRALPLLVSTAVTTVITAGAHRIEIYESLSKLSVQHSAEFVRGLFSMTTVYSFQAGIYNIMSAITGGNYGATGNFGATYSAAAGAAVASGGGTVGMFDGHGALQSIKAFWSQVWNQAFSSLIHTYESDSMFMTNMNEKIHLNWQNIQYNALYVFSSAFRKAVQDHQTLGGLNTKVYSEPGGALLSNMFASLYARNVANSYANIGRD